MDELLSDMEFMKTLLETADQLDQVVVSDEVYKLVEQHSKMLATGILMAQVQWMMGQEPESTETITYLVKQVCQIGYTAGQNSVLYKDDEETAS